MNVYRPDVDPALLHFFARDLAGEPDVRERLSGVRGRRPALGRLLHRDRDVAGGAPGGPAGAAMRGAHPLRRLLSASFTRATPRWRPFAKPCSGVSPSSSFATIDRWTSATRRPRAARAPPRIRAAWPGGPSASIAISPRCLRSCAAGSRTGWTSRWTGATAVRASWSASRRASSGAISRTWTARVLVELPASMVDARWCVGARLLVAARDHARLPYVADTWAGAAGSDAQWNTCAPTVADVWTSDVDRLSAAQEQREPADWRRCVDLSFALFLRQGCASRLGAPLASCFALRAGGRAGDRAPCAQRPWRRKARVGAPARASPA